MKGSYINLIKWIQYSIFFHKWKWFIIEPNDYESFVQLS